MILPPSLPPFLQVCGPGKAQHCDKNLYVSGICYLMDTKHHETRNITTGYQKCLKGNVDLVFLFDGSQSMSTDNFNTIKEFMIRVMEELHNSTIHFAAVQFSKNVNVAFQFNDYIRDPNPQKLLAKVEHEALVTNTFKAIEYVAQNVFTSENGMREGANKVMIIITDGEATDEYNNVDGKSIRAAKKKGILRLVIGIGHHFNSTESQQKLQTIASEPTQEFVKVLAGFEELKDSFNDLQSKIYAIEGTDVDILTYFLFISLHAPLTAWQDRIVLGAVGADNWAGGLLEQQKGLIGEKFITTPSHRKEMDGAYLGYSLAFLQHQKKEFYAVGAPRYQHVGRVLIFGARSSPSNWTLTQEIEGKQIGSYFGGVLCSVDLDNNNETDLLLIGAPQHFEDMKGGRVYVYSWAQVGKLGKETGYSLGRFGAAMTDLADINGDGLADVAVGAPLEDENRGAVYIYHGFPSHLAAAFRMSLLRATESQ
uniref:Integrin subunit alpha L n=1 Tax=Salvator merianae TaxID=96440 RepID=A0A8D0BMN0_SALMN